MHVSSSRPWIVPVREAPPGGIQLFCFPYAGAGAAVYRGWASGLSGAVGLSAVQPPGRESRIGAKPIDDMAEMIAATSAALAPAIRGPYAFFGHSLGAIVAYETARALLAKGAPAPCRTFVSGHRAPHLPDDTPPIHDLPDAAFVREVAEMNGMPPELLEHEELVALLLPALRADFKLAHDYRPFPGPPLAGPIVALGGRDDPFVAPETVAAWRTATSAAFRCELFPGDHFYLNGQRDAVLALVSQELAAAGERARP